MLEAPNDPAQGPHSSSRYESYLEFSIGKKHGVQSQSEKNIIKTSQT